ncbi:MAG: CoA transferase, partial [Betaproteobacteria bacterium]
MSETLPLAGIRVVEFTHMVMGPTCGMILADLGAEVIKVEPIAGDNTRTIHQAAATKSAAVDLHTPRNHGQAAAAIANGQGSLP